jgi:hypothetical protein
MFRILVAVLVLAASCKDKANDYTIEPPETPLFVKDGVGYGVVTVSFAHILAEPPPAPPEPAGLIRKGGVVLVIARRNIWVEAGVGRLWALVEIQNKELGSVLGWLPGESFEFYESLPKAETASARMWR